MNPRRAPVYIVDDDEVSRTLYKTVLEHHGVSELRLIADGAEVLPQIPAVGCMKLGAFDYLTRPVERSRLWASVRNALDLVELQREVGSLGLRV